MTTASPFAVYIPAMHQELVPVVVRFLPLFDPGCGQEEGYRPQDLPMDPREARHYQREMLAWGREVDKPSDLASLAAQMQGDPMVRVTNDLRGELAELSRMAGTGTSATASPPGLQEQGLGRNCRIRARRRWCSSWPGPWKRPCLKLQRLALIWMQNGRVFQAALAWRMVKPLMRPWKEP